MNELFVGDCLEHFSKLPPIDLIFADPPFNIGYKYDKYNDNKPKEEYLAWCKQWIEASYKALSFGGSFWIAIGDEYAAELKVLSEAAGFTLRNWVIWYYTFGVQCERKFARSHTHLLYFVKGTEFTFNGDEVRVPSARQTIYRDKRAVVGGRVPENTWLYRPDSTSFTGEEDSWHVPRICGTFGERVNWHPCQMPEAILSRIIRVSSSKGQSVYDPFAGSGTTLVVAKQLGRNYFGSELSPEYAKKVEERLWHTIVQK